jgi:hypothetical protein
LPPHKLKRIHGTGHRISGHRASTYSKAYGDSALKAAQLALLSAQSRKTRAEALNTELQEPYNKALADVYCEHCKQYLLIVKIY